MKKLLAFLNPYKKECICAPLFKMLEACFDLLVPLVIAAIIDNGIGKNLGGSYVIRMCLVLIALGIIGITCAVTAQYFSARAAVGFASSLRHAIFSHLQSLSYTEIDTLGTSNMITRMTSDVNQMQNGVNLTLRLFLRSPFIVLGAMVMAFTIDSKCAMIFLILIVTLSAIVYLLMRISVPLMKQVQKRLDGITGITRENLTGVRVIRAFGQEDHEKAEFTKRNADFTANQMKAGGVSALMNPLTYVVVNAAVIWLIWTGAIRVNMGALSQGQVVALYNYMSQILVELIKFANVIVSINKAIACGNRIQSVLDMKSSMTEGDLDLRELPADCDSAVAFDHVELKYKGSPDPSLEDIDFTVKPGSVTGIIGGTGSGKTSLVNLISRFYDASKGSVTIGGKDIKAYRYEALRSLVGVVPQKAVLFKGTIRDNLTFGSKDISDDNLYLALETAQALDVVEKKGGLDGLIEQGGRNLSGGQRQRLTIARALAKKPKILILDDSASALDYATDAALRDALKALPDSLTVFIVSQRASSIRHADQIIVLDDGMMAGKGSHEELLASCEVYQEIYYSQYKKEGENS